jgi:hypothetical protein
MGPNENIEINAEAISLQLQFPTGYGLNRDRFNCSNTKKVVARLK